MRLIRNQTLSFLRGDMTSADFELTYPPAWGPLGRDVYLRTYSRGDERWCDTVKRVVVASVAHDNSLSSDDAADLFELVYEFKMVPAGRHLWISGTELSYARSNCWVAGWGWEGDRNPSAHLRFLAARLFEGGGVGSDYSTAVLPNEVVSTTPVEVQVYCDSDHPDFHEVSGSAADAGITLHHSPVGRLVEDTREGWVDAWCALIDHAFSGGGNIIFDISRVRPKGAELKRFGGRASGPGPLVRALAGMVEVLNSATGRSLGPLDWMSLDHHAASAIVAGGARRSARMSIVNWADPAVFDFINCKSDTSQHWSTNISLAIDADFRAAVNDPLHAQHEHAVAVLNAAAAGMIANGEPGLVDVDLASEGEPVPVRVTNPCGELFLDDGVHTGVGMGESCVIGSVNLAKYGPDDEGAIQAFEKLGAYLVRAGEAKHTDDSAVGIEAKNRRIGAGFMGLQTWCAAKGAKLSELASRSDLLDLLSQFKDAVRRGADSQADALSAPRPIKVTAIAPTGTIALLAGTEPGVHPVFARKFVRRVRFTNTDPRLQEISSLGNPVEPCVYAADTSVVSYLTVADSYAEYGDLIEQADELSPSDFMALVAAVQGSFTDNAVSATGELPEDYTADELAADIRSGLGKVKGVTFFPPVSRPQAPFERISNDEWDKRVAIGEPVSGGPATQEECQGGACPIR